MRTLLLTCVLLFTGSWLSAAEVSDLPEDLQKLVTQLINGDDKERKAAAKDIYKLKEKAAATAPWVQAQYDKEDNVWVKKELRKALRSISAESDDEENEQEAADDTSKNPAKDESGNVIPLPNPAKMPGRVIFSPDGIGKMGGGASNCKVEVKEIPGVKTNNKYISMHLTGKEWSGNIINWCDFWDQSPFAVNPEQHTHMVLRCLYLGRPGDVNLTVSMQFKATGDQEGAASDFLRLSNYDSKHLLQKSRTFVDIAIPIEDFQRSIDPSKHKNFIWGVHFGNMSHQNDKDMGLLLKSISFVKAR